jgi:hypothetical protein
VAVVQAAAVVQLKFRLLWIDDISRRCWSQRTLPSATGVQAARPMLLMLVTSTRKVAEKYYV